MSLSAESRYLIISNVSKKNNVLSLLKTAQSFNFVPIIVGLVKLSNGINCLQFDKLDECKTFLIQNNIKLVGIEIMQNSISVLDHPFEKSIAFMPGNEGTGLNDKQKSVCDYFIFIPQYGNGTASLNVNVATSIILHHYHIWTISSNQVTSCKCETV